MQIWDSKMYVQTYLDAGIFSFWTKDLRVKSFRAFRDKVPNDKHAKY